jgi:hypothetical protein
MVSINISTTLQKNGRDYADFQQTQFHGFGGHFEGNSIERFANPRESAGLIRV